MHRISATNDEDDFFNREPAKRNVSPGLISGLHMPRSLIPPGIAADLAHDLLDRFSRSSSDQLMFFGRQGFGPCEQPAVESEGLPLFLTDLLRHLQNCLVDELPTAVYSLLFPRPDESPYPARQVIVNMYRPGQGITPHVDLLTRFGDGIIIISLLSGIVMTLAATDPEDPSVLKRDATQIWLPSRSIIVLEGDARYCFTHGIEPRMDDFVEDSNGSADSALWIDRSLRLSITIRWMLPNAHVVQ